MACRNCTDICNCAVVSGNARAAVTGTGTAADPYTVTVAAVVQTETFTYPGTLVVNTGTVRRTFSHAATITNVGASVGTVPTGAAIKIDVNKNGSSIFTSGARPTIAISDDDAGTSNVPNVTTAIAALDYLTIDIDQVGSGVAGADLTVTIEYYR